MCWTIVQCLLWFLALHGKQQQSPEDPAAKNNFHPCSSVLCYFGYSSTLKSNLPFLCNQELQ